MSAPGLEQSCCCRPGAALPPHTASSHLCIAPHVLGGVHTYIVQIFTPQPLSIKQITWKTTTKAKQANRFLFGLIISLVHEFNKKVRKGKEQSLVHSLNTQAEVVGSDVTVSICMSTSRHRHLMFRCYWSLCRSPPPLLYQCSSKGRRGRNCDSAGNHFS